MTEQPSIELRTVELETLKAWLQAVEDLQEHVHDEPEQADIVLHTLAGTISRVIRQQKPLLESLAESLAERGITLESYEGSDNVFTIKGPK